MPLTRALLAAGLLAACASMSAPPDGAVIDIAFSPPADLSGSSACVIALHQSNDGGACLVEWSCVEAGVLVLACGPADGGVACLCGEADQQGTPVGQAPPTCSDGDVTTFARDRCGWRSL